MPSYLDLAVLAIVLISAFLSMLRGFSREVLAIASWAAAAAAAYYFYPVVVPYLTPYIHKEIDRAGDRRRDRVLRHPDRRVAVHRPAVGRDSRQQDRGARPDARFRVRGRAGLPARGGGFRDLQLVGLGQAAAGMGKERQDPSDPDGYRGQDRRPAAGRRGVDDRRLDQVARQHSPGERRAGRRIRRADPGQASLAARPAAAVSAQKKAKLSPNSNTLDKQKLDALINKNVPQPAPATPAVIPKQ